MPGPDIFLSCNREDAGRAKQFARGFAAQGLDVWRDAHLRSGEACDRVTEKALRGAKAVVVCSYFNRPDEALTHPDAIHRLAPRGNLPHIRAVQRAGALYMAGRCEEALAALADFKACWPGGALEHVERMHKGSVLAPNTAEELQELFATAWHAAKAAKNPA